jgi:CDP-4-dehydro-6-deoxyglucose reductase, E1
MNNFLYIRKRFKRFEDKLATINPAKYEQMAPYAFPVILKEGLPFTRDEMVSYLEKNGIDTRSLFLSMPTQCAGFKFLGYKFGQFPEAEYISNNGFHIGIHQDIGKLHIDYFIEKLGEFLHQYNAGKVK